MSEDDKIKNEKIELSENEIWKIARTFPESDRHLVTTYLKNGATLEEIKKDLVDFDKIL